MGISVMYGDVRGAGEEQRQKKVGEVAIKGRIGKWGSREKERWRD
jgi:hypothetical protein